MQEETMWYKHHKTQTILSLLLSLFFAIIILPSCGKNLQECESKEDCDAPNVCIQVAHKANKKYCTKKCTKSSDCAHLGAKEGFCYKGFCDIAQNCEQHTECAKIDKDFTCQKNLCLPPGNSNTCNANTDCTGGQVCVNGKCQDVIIKETTPEDGGGDRTLIENIEPAEVTEGDAGENLPENPEESPPENVEPTELTEQVGEVVPEIVLPEMKSCTNATDCDPGYSCRDGHCWKLCALNSDCTKPFICRADMMCGFKIECFNSFECKTGFHCVKEKCVSLPTCKSLSDCPSAYGCRDSKCLRLCNNDAECNDSKLVCLNSMCSEKPECVNPFDCVEGYYCDIKKGKCLKIPSCKTVTDCPSGYTCAKQNCALMCAMHTDCYAAEYCHPHFNACVNNCKTHADCLVGGYLCDSATKHCKSIYTEPPRPEPGPEPQPEPVVDDGGLGPEPQPELLPESKPCTFDTSCKAKGPNYICVSGKCVLGCISNASCKAGETCQSGRCKAKICSKDTDCKIFGAQYICTSAKCIAGCITNAACSGQICVSGRCTAQVCSNDTICKQLGAHYICTSSKCVAGCTTNAACSGQMCMSGRCTAFACSNDTICKPLGVHYICTATKCVAGCKTNADCKTSETCKSGRCTVQTCTGKMIDTVCYKEFLPTDKYIVVLKVAGNDRYIYVEGVDPTFSWARIESDGGTKRFAVTHVQFKEKTWVKVDTTIERDKLFIYMVKQNSSGWIPTIAHYKVSLKMEKIPRRAGASTWFHEK